MKILLLNNNSSIGNIVKKICEKNNYELEGEFSQDSFDIVIVDDEYYSSNDSTLEINELDTECMILLSGGVKSYAGFDYYLQKPFLPKQLLDLINSDEVKEDLGDRETLALNIKDIDEIKELLSDDDFIQNDEQEDELEKFMNKTEMDLKKVWHEISSQGRV